MSFTPAFSFVSELPTTPAVYVLYGGQGHGKYIAYVGLTSNLKDRIGQHFIRRDSSVVTGTSAAMLNPDYVTEMEWWSDSRFEERHVLEAAELVAFDIFEPALRSRGRITNKARELAKKPEFAEEMREMFQNRPSGHVVIPSLEEALRRINLLEKQVSELQRRLNELETPSSLRPLEAPFAYAVAVSL